MLLLVLPFCLLVLYFYPSAKSRRGIVMITVSVSVNISHFSHCRSQFRSDPYQTWYDEWLWVGDDAYCWILRSSDHSRSGPLISTENLTFSYIFHTGDRNSSWISTKLGMNDGVGSGTDPIQWRHDDVITDFTVRWLRTKNLVYLCLPPFLTPLEWR